ncbi:MAG: hypothetical protein K2M37_05635 [Muribaculaceae bacterium]|nr:hypothetical protein [Muribaculaceae bacterium]
MIRTGCIYSEFTNKGRRSVRYKKGCKPIYCFRWVGEISIRGKRYRCRSTNRHNVEMWLEDMIRKQETI